MNTRIFAYCLALAGLPLVAQAPAPAASQAHASDLGFSYTLPADWDVMDAQASLPVIKDQATQNAKSEDEKKGVACVQMLLTARHGEPTSVLVEVALPFACFGKEMTEKDLPGFATGASEGLKQAFDIDEPVYGSYALGTHGFWIERAKGAPKGHPEMPYTVEITCSVLKKAAVCWMTMAADDTALKTFEQGNVTLEDEAPVALVPATAFTKKP
jgi:hypothetical protein